ncbi:MAG: tRNA (N6-threonylcarbamoyladenosine(37)-N6)-methyltransferase TrmO [Chloroflexi bacterium RBG_16_56_11]|nr:MAG: tRNA (N6-threonylcarbamoyladenosine(37)-N6)-methyltransferase TrmO [Chloroflexi bacterium RBG_16_56_11]
MSGELEEITLRPIGFVRSEIKRRERRDASGTVAEIVLEPELTEALDNIDEFSHIIVIYWMHQSRRPAPTKVHPRYRKERSPVGVLASRSPDRPNPLGKTTVRLVGRNANVLTVRGLDAIDGTPVIDIKPYIPGLDAVADARVPQWMMEN